VSAAPAQAEEPGWEEALADGLADTTAGVWHGRAPHSDGEPVLELDEAQLVDALRDGVTEQLASCSASLLVVWDAGGTLAPSVVSSALAPLTKSQHSGPPVLLLMLREGVRVDSPDAAWARRLLPSALDSVDLGGDTPETPEEKSAREAAARQKLKEFQEQRRIELEQQAARDAAAAQVQQQARRTALRARIDNLVRSRAEARHAARAKAAIALDKKGDGSSAYSFEDLASAGGYIGQEWAVEMIRPSIENRLHGFDRRKQALVVVFTGPSGVGKTELAQHIAAMLHSTTPAAMREGGSKAHCFVQIPMNQYQNEASISNLIGPPVGIMGEGQLTGALRKCPTATVLLDEFEKAHPRAIPDVFLGAFDKNARLTDTKNGRCSNDATKDCTSDEDCKGGVVPGISVDGYCDRVVRTDEATFILTSNLGAEVSACSVSTLACVRH
jgi:energy-coupling factor transporter ATP-binding protein EcfA2